jgi:hypothetical protein
MPCPSCGAVLPEPRERFCPSCGADLDALAAPLDAAALAPPLDEAPLAPPASTARRPRPGGIPWEDRGRIGFLQALIETTQKVLTAPSAFFASMPVTGGIGGPLLYGMVVGSAGVIVAALYREVFRALMGSTFMALGGGSEMRRLMPLVTGGLSVVLQVVFAPLAVILGLFIAAAIVHLMLLLLGGARSGFEATLRVMCYSEGAAIINVIPFCGGVVSGVYFLVLAIIGVAAAHGIGGGKAAAAVLLPLALLCCCCAGAGMLLVGGLASVLSQMK